MKEPPFWMDKKASIFQVSINLTVGFRNWDFIDVIDINVIIDIFFCIKLGRNMYESVKRNSKFDGP